MKYMNKLARMVKTTVNFKVANKRKEINIKASEVPHIKSRILSLSLFLFC